MLTPLDIQNKEFSKSLRGYKEVEVDSFLDEIIVDYEQIYKENKELKNKIEMLNDQLKHYSALEDTLQKTLVVAQTTAEDVIFTARKKGDVIIDESNSRAERIVESARDQVLTIKKEYDEIKQEIFSFNSKYKSLLSSQLETIENYSKKEHIFNSREKRSEDAFKDKQEMSFKSDLVDEGENISPLCDFESHDSLEMKTVELKEDIKDLSQYGSKPLLD